MSGLLAKLGQLFPKSSGSNTLSDDISSQLLSAKQPTQTNVPTANIERERARNKSGSVGEYKYAFFNDDILKQLKTNFGSSGFNDKHLYSEFAQPYPWVSSRWNAMRDCYNSPRFADGHVLSMEGFGVRTTNYGKPVYRLSVLFFTGMVKGTMAVESLWITPEDKKLLQ